MAETTTPSLDERYPEHAKQRKIIDKSEAIHGFLEWARSRDLEFGRVVTDRVAVFEGTEDVTSLHPAEGMELKRLLADYFGLSLTTLDAEKEQMVDDLRAANTPQEA